MHRITRDELTGSYIQFMMSAKRYNQYTQFGAERKGYTCASPLCRLVVHSRDGCYSKLTGIAYFLLPPPPSSPPPRIRIGNRPINPHSISFIRIVAGNARAHRSGTFLPIIVFIIEYSPRRFAVVQYARDDHDDVDVRFFLNIFSLRRNSRAQRFLFVPLLLVFFSPRPV